MPQLFDELKQSALEWRRRGYDCDDYPLIGGILSFQMETQEGTSTLKYLRLLRRTYDWMKEGRLFAESTDYEDKHDLSFHYMPYNFDSGPERSFFRQVLSALNTDPYDVEAFLFVGGLTDPKKTDFHFEYMGEDRRCHRYFPDFVIVKKTGEFYIVEVKSESERGDQTVKKRKRWWRGCRRCSLINSDIMSFILRVQKLMVPVEAGCSLGNLIRSKRNVQRICRS